MTNTMKKALSIILAAAMIFTMSASFNFGKAYAGETYTYDLGKGVKITTDKDLDNTMLSNPAGNDKYVEFTVHVESEDTLYEARIKEDYNMQWGPSELSGKNSVDLHIKTNVYGKLTLYIDTNTSGSVTKEFYVAPKVPSNIKFYTTNTAVFFDTMTAIPSMYGTHTWVAITTADGSDVGHWVVKNQCSYRDSEAHTGLEAGKKYKFYYYGYDPTSGFTSEKSDTKTVVMGPSTQPVIKSIKVSKVKVTKVKGSGHWQGSNWVYNYKTSWTTTVVLKKKAAGIKGIEVFDGVDYSYPAKGNKSKYVIKMSRIGENFNHKGSTLGFAVRTYSDNTCKAYSPWSAIKKVKIK